jgi:hypothetical protein
VKFIRIDDALRDTETVARLSVLERVLIAPLMVVGTVLGFGLLRATETRGKFTDLVVVIVSCERKHRDVSPSDDALGHTPEQGTRRPRTARLSHPSGDARTARRTVPEANETVED